MNITDIKETFYNRYNSSDDFLHFTATGALCTLLGHSETDGAPFLSCALSMGVMMLARRLGGNAIKIQAVDSDRLFSYVPSTPPEIFKNNERDIAEIVREVDKYNIGGAEILYKASIPDFLPKKMEFDVTLVRSLLKTGGVEADELEIASLAARSSPLEPYIAAAYAKSGYCTLISSSAPKNYPLPLSGFKIVSAHCTEKDRSRTDKIRSAFEQIQHRYPEVRSIEDIARDHVDIVKDRTAANYMRHIAGENIRIGNAVYGLKKCDIKALFREMNASQRSMERFWDLGSEHLFLLRCAKGVQGVHAARCHRSGITAVIENDMVDYAINLIMKDFENNIGYQPTFCISEA